MILYDMDSTTSNLTPEHVAAYNIARTGSIRYAAKKSGLTVDQIKTLRRTSPQFRDLVLEYTTESTVKTARSIEAVVPLALETLVDEMKKVSKKTRHIGRPRKDEPPVTVEEKLENPNPTRVRAARTILEFWLKSREVYDINIRLRDIENFMNNPPSEIEPLPQLEVISSSTTTETNCEVQDAETEP